MLSYNSFIAGVGHYLPNKIVTNDELAKTVDTNDAWIVERTGIRQRHIADAEELSSDMASKAAHNALMQAGIAKNAIDMIVVATTTPDRTFPATAAIVQSKLAIQQGFAFDVQAVCAGFLYALNTADNYIRSGQCRHVLVIGVDKMSSIVDWQDRKTCVLFGDGAGAVVLSRADEKSVSQVIGSELHTAGEYASILCTDGGVGVNQQAGLLRMEGQEVYKHAVQKMTSSLESIMQKHSIAKEVIDWLIPHQANIRIIQSVGKKLKLPEEKVVVTVHDHANTSAASIPLALSESYHAGKITKGQLVGLAAIGGGLSWGSSLIRL